MNNQLAIVCASVLHGLVSVWSHLAPSWQGHDTAPHDAAPHEHKHASASLPGRLKSERKAPQVYNCDGHCKCFYNVYGTVTDEKHCPSYTMKLAKKKNLPFVASVQHACPKHQCYDIMGGKGTMKTVTVRQTGRAHCRSEQLERINAHAW